MINHQPTEILGESINHWDRFYSTHYDWLYKSSLQLKGTELLAQEFTQKIFTKILLSHPEIIVNGSKEAVSMEVSILFPDLKALLEDSRIVSPAKLMNIFYSPN